MVLQEAHLTSVQSTPVALRFFTKLTAPQPLPSTTTRDLTRLRGSKSTRVALA